MADKAQQIPETIAIESPAETWGLDLVPAGCPVCRQAHLIPPDHIGRRCPKCRLGILERQPALLRREPPEKLIPFKIEPAVLSSMFSKFVEPVRFRPDDLSATSLSQRAVPVYWPMWLVDADVTGDWHAEVGFDYQVQSSQATYTGSEWRSSELTETRIRWEPRLGILNRHYDNVAAPALEAQDTLLTRLGKYEKSTAETYSPDRLQVGHTPVALMVPDLQPESVWPEADAQAQKRAANDCRTAAGGQHIRNFAINPDYTQLNWTQMLLPMYISFYTRDDGQPELVYVNAQSGQIGGLRLSSQRKGNRWAVILLVISLVLLVIGILGTVFGALLPPLSIVGILFIVAAFATGVAAIYPVAYPWQWNRQQQDQKIVTQR